MPIQAMEIIDLETRHTAYALVCIALGCWPIIIGERNSLSDDYPATGSKISWSLVHMLQKSHLTAWESCAAGIPHRAGTEYLNRA